MLALEGQAGQRVAEYIPLITPLGWLRADLQGLGRAALPGARPWPQVRQLLGQGHRAVVAVMGVVNDLVVRTHHSDTVCWLTSST
ncbi:hypothetical protein D3C85_1621090 [compost metagenome]